MEEKFTINIGRQLGSGGRQIGEQLANLFGISFYDKELIMLASKKSGLGKEFFELADERSRFSLFGGMYGFPGSFGEEIICGNYLSNEALFKIQSDVIRELAEQKSAVFVGRCADYILKDSPRCLNVFVCADLDIRIKRIAEINNISEKEAKEIILKTDKRRSGYYNYYTEKKWGRADSYHLCINSSVLGVDKTISYIQKFAEQLFGLTLN